MLEIKKGVHYKADRRENMHAEIVKRRDINGFFPISKNSLNFLEKFYPQATSKDWINWRWQLQNRITSLKELGKFLELSEDEKSAIERHTGSLPLGITPYYLSLLDKTNPQQPIRRTHIMVNDEYLIVPAEAKDPLGEDGHTVVPGLVHRYPDRVLFLVTGFCSTYCRYCTRSRIVGGDGEYSFSQKAWDAAIEYIKSHTEVRDCLLSGGDPLSLPYDKLEWLLSSLRAIPHLEFIRIGTKIPVVLPQRITPDLIKVLKKVHPLWMNIHFTHPDEVTEEVQESCKRLADAGIPLGSQTVLLKGINDDISTLKNLFHRLLTIRVRPYYLYQCDPVPGSSHFRTSVAKGLEIIKGLRGHTTGCAIPTYVIDAPGGGGKISLQPDYIVGKEGNDILLINYRGKVYRYADTCDSN